MPRSNYGVAVWAWDDIQEVLVEDCGYGRRLPQVEDLEARFESRSVP
jgi:hypothetical protein